MEVAGLSAIRTGDVSARKRQRYNASQKCLQYTGSATQSKSPPLVGPGRGFAFKFRGSHLGFNRSPRESD